MKRIGIIGCGKIAQVRHIPELDANPDAQIVGYYNPTPSYAIEIIGQEGTKEQLDVEPIQTNDNQTTSGMSDLFIKVLESGATQEFPISAASVLPAMRVIFAAIESDRKGQEITITENYTKKI